MGTTIINTTFKLKRATAARWEEVNPVLQLGEPGFVKDEYRLKIGDGITPWIDLPYVGEDNVQNFDTHFDFPAIGRSNVIYKAEDEKMLYQWNTKKLAFEAIGSIGGGSVVVDAELSLESENPIQNKAITSYVRDIEAKEEARPVNKLLSAEGSATVSLAAADNKTIVERVSELGVGMFTLTVDAGVVDSPAPGEKISGMCQITSWNGLEDFNGWIMMFGVNEAYSQVIVNGQGKGWIDSNALDNIKIINGGNANG